MRVSTSLLSVVSALTVLSVLGPRAVVAQGPKAAAKAAPTPSTSTITGSYAGTATVPLGDSTIVVPVSYTFAPGGASGTAIVPGQGSGAISNVVRTGNRLRFRVTAGENKQLEHDGTVTTDGRIEGFVNLENKPVARFRIAPGTLPAPKAAPGTRPKGGARNLRSA
jgi:hypothetical protein